MNLELPLVLASQSPRRKALLEAVGYSPIIRKTDVEESFPPDLPLKDVAGFIAQKKANSIHEKSAIVIAADTVVICDEKILGKPGDHAQAFEMLTLLSGRPHEVMTSVCISFHGRVIILNEITNLLFRSLSKENIEQYIHLYQPFDKAGAYGIQEIVPAGVNLCSEAEKNFMEEKGFRDLYVSTFTLNKTNWSLDAVASIKGSYFNVVGLPIHRVCQTLESLG